LDLLYVVLCLREQREQIDSRRVIRRHGQRLFVDSQIVLAKVTAGAKGVEGAVEVDWFVDRVLVLVLILESLES